MVHITVGIAQFFVILLTQMATVMFGVLAAGGVTCGVLYLLYRALFARRRTRPDRAER